MPGNRRSIRLKEYDYSDFGYYHVTICTQDRELYFENNNVKQMIENIWTKLPTKFNVDLDECVVMPNHLHGVIVINDNENVGADPCVCPDNGIIKNQGAHINHNQGAHTGAPLQGQKPTLGKIIQWFKTMTTNYYIQNVKTNHWPWFAGRLWQRNYYERIIHNNRELNRIRQYIINNLANWATDRNNPKNFL